MKEIIYDMEKKFKDLKLEELVLLIVYVVYIFWVFVCSFEDS